MMPESAKGSLGGLVAWITGSSRGIGKKIAEHFAACGANIVIHGTSQDSPKTFNEGKTLDESARALEESYGIRSLAISGDLTDYGVVEEAVAQIHATFGTLDILVNCAGGDVGTKGVTASLAGKPEKNDAIGISLEDARTVLDRNLLTTIHCCKAACPGMVGRKKGRVINIGSIAATFGIPQSVIYATAKAAVHEYTRCLAVQLRPYDITANVLAPGDTVTERFLHSRDTDESRKVLSGTLERYGRPIEVARTAEFLASEAGSFVSGQVIRVDGGSQTWAC
jgi:3-oxoacyl-[acyl-carrier protein] reductase